jgi:peptide/nickel transport system substrate-binding protein
MRGIARAFVAVVAWTLVAAIGAGIATAQEEESASPSAEQRRTLTIGTTEDIRTTNPLRSLNVIEAWTFSYMYQGMLGMNREDLSAVPRLVEEWTQSDDGLTWTFTFRDDVLWSDGEPLTAHDFAFTANFLIEYDKDIASWNKNTDFPFTESIEATDDRTVVWKTSRPTFAPGKPEYYLVLPEHIWGDMTGEEANKFKNFPDPVVNGPFTLTEREQGQFWRLEPNPNWWGDPVDVDEIVFRVFNTQEAVVQAMRRGTVDFAESIPAALFETLQPVQTTTDHVGAATVFVNFNFNLMEQEKSTGHPALLDVNVRRAIAHAIDKELLVERVRRGYATPGTTVVPPSNAFWHYEPTEEEFYEFDLEEANRILDDAGYVDTDNDGVREMPDGGQPLEFRFFVLANDTDAVKSAVFIENWLEEIGIQLNTESMNNASVLEHYYAGDFDVYWYGWSTGPDPDFLLSTFTPDECGFWSDTCWDNPDYTALYNEQRTTFLAEERQEIVRDLQQMIYNEVPEIVVWYDNNLQSYRADRWQGFVELGPDGDLLDQATPYSVVRVQPATEGSATGTAEGGLPGIVWVLIVGAIVLIGVGFVVARRRAEDRA